MKIEPKLVGIASIDELLNSWKEPEPWKPQYYPYIPLDIISHPPDYLFTLGSGVITSPWASMATISIFGHEYKAAVDVFRNDWEDGQRVIDVDHYIFADNKGVVTAWLYPPTSYHHLKITDKIVEVTPPQWKYFIEETLAR